MDSNTITQVVIIVAFVANVVTIWQIFKRKGFNKVWKRFDQLEDRFDNTEKRILNIEGYLFQSRTVPQCQEEEKSTT